MESVERRQDRAEWIVLLVLFFVMSTTLIVPAYQERDELIARERERLTAATQVIEQDLKRMIEGVDRAILNVRAQLPDWKRRPDGAALAAKELKVLADAMPGVRSMLLLDASGVSIAVGADDGIHVPAQIDASDTEPFRNARRVADPNLLLVSAPYRTKAGVWTFSLARTIARPDGSFDGMVAAVIDPEELKLVLASTRMVEDQFAAVVHGRGGLILIEPSNRGNEGDSMALPGTFFSRHMASGQQISVLEGSSPASHWEGRIMALRTVRIPALHMDQPLVVLDGRNTDAVLASWKRLVQGRIVAVALGGLFSAAGLAFWQRNRRQTRRALMDKVRQMNQVFDSTLSLLAILDLGGRCVRLSAAWYHTMGWPVDTMIGQPIRPLIHPDDHATTDAARQSLDAAGLLTDFHFRMRDATGAYRELMAQAVMLNELIYLDVRDVTLEKSSQRELQLLNAQLRDINLQLEAKNLRLQEQERELLALSLIDPLTGVANRRRFDEALLTEWRQGMRERRPLSLLMLDIDHFKEFNDRYGHLAGDSCLKAVASALHDRVHRPHDLLARFGGEEFAVLLPNTDAAGAHTLAEDLLRAIEALRIPHEGSTAATVVTLSIGIKTLLPDEVKSVSELLGDADVALYRAKQYGRNRLCVALHGH